MPSSWTQNYYHAVFGTRHRTPWISPEIEPRVHSFIGGIANDLGCTPIAVNGMAEHLHVLVRYPSDLSNADLVMNIKSRSSKWIHQTFRDLREFAWQKGYGGFTISLPGVPKVEAYVRNQKNHHQKVSFKSEYLKILRQTGWEGNPDELFE